MMPTSQLTLGRADLAACLLALTLAVLLGVVVGPVNGAVAATPATPATAPPVTISPLPGTPDATPSTQISFLGAPASELHDVAVVGSRSGSHSGKLYSYSTVAGASFLPARGFD
jgi:hypothetical protein